MADIVISDHALDRLELRKLDMALVLDVIRDPTQVIIQENGRVVHQRLVDRHGPQSRLARSPEEDGETVLVVTVLDSSKINEYWEAK